MSTTANTIIRPDMRFTCLQDWLCWQESLHNTAIKLGLDRCRTVAERMGLLKPDFKIISISGTNGKGSSAAMLDKSLRQMGFKVGTYTSPHLLTYNERISIDDIHIDDDSLCHTFERIDRHRGDISLTYFEFGTLAALDIFHAASIDIAVMEVGLGGRLDAVNILDADIALVTTVDFDHEVWLGHDRESIGREKAGIFRPGRLAVCADRDPPCSIAEHARDIGAELYRAGIDFDFSVNPTDWSWRGHGKEYTHLPLPGINRRQVQNAAGVLMVLTLLLEKSPFNSRAIYTVLRDFRLAGRLQSIPGETPCLLDVAHNPQAVAALVDHVQEISGAGANHLIIGMLKDKNHAAVFTLLQPIADRWYVADINSDRAAPATELAQALAEYVETDNISLYPNVALAIARAQANARPGDRIIITGSFVTVGAAIEYLDS